MTGPRRLRGCWPKQCSRRHLDRSPLAAVPAVEEGAVQEVQQVRLPQDGVMVEVPLPVVLRAAAVAEQQGRHQRHRHLLLSHQWICG